MRGNPYTGQHNLSTGHQQGNWSVLIPTESGFVEARNRYGAKADFRTEVQAKEFANTFLGAKVVRFHTAEWESLLGYLRRTRPTRRVSHWHPFQVGALGV